MRFDVLTLFPEIFSGYLSQSLLKLAIGRRLVEVHLHDIRDWAPGRHRVVDDRPYGGGPGMILKAEPVVECVEAVQAGYAAPSWHHRPAGLEVKKKHHSPAEPGAKQTSGEAIHGNLDTGHLVMLTPQGRRLDQPIVEELAQYKRLLLLCGRYEGFDDRVRQILEPDEISIGDYVLGGGEVAAMVVIDAVVRLLPGVLGDEQSPWDDSFSGEERLLEGPQFTRPREYRGLAVPDVLLNGNHDEIEHWRREQSLRKTRERRMDLLEKKNGN
jgi:tRNA (guanine37-N1)-methyltransferase